MELNMNLKYMSRFSISTWHSLFSYPILIEKRVVLISMDKKQQVQLEDQLLNVQKSASFLDVSANTIRRWAQLGNLKGVKIGTRGDWRFTKKDLLQMVRKGKI